MLVKRSVETLQGFRDEFGVDVYDQTGWCFLVPPEAEPSFVENMARAPIARSSHVGNNGRGGDGAPSTRTQSGWYWARCIRAGRRLCGSSCDVPRRLRPGRGTAGQSCISTLPLPGSRCPRAG